MVFPSDRKRNTKNGDRFPPRNERQTVDPKIGAGIPPRKERENADTTIGDSFALGRKEKTLTQELAMVFPP